MGKFRTFKALAEAIVEQLDLPVEETETVKERLQRPDVLLREVQEHPSVKKALRGDTADLRALLGFENYQPAASRSTLRRTSAFAIRDGMAYGDVATAEGYFPQQIARAKDTDDSQAGRVRRMEKEKERINDKLSMIDEEGHYPAIPVMRGELKHAMGVNPSQYKKRSELQKVYRLALIERLESLTPDEFALHQTEGGRDRSESVNRRSVSKEKARSVSKSGLDFDEEIDPDYLDEIREIAQTNARRKSSARAVKDIKIAAALWCCKTSGSNKVLPNSGDDVVFVLSDISGGPVNIVTGTAQRMRESYEVEGTTSSTADITDIVNELRRVGWITLALPEQFQELQ